jgi:alpha-glucosidase
MYRPVANPAAVVVHGKARFTILTPCLVRMEWAPDGVFEDRASFAIVHRDLPVPAYRATRHGKVLTIATDNLAIRYSGGRFSASSLSIEFKSNGRRATWKPGTRPTGNLKGTIRTLDDVSGAVPLDDGILSCDGWALVDDSKALRLGGGDWPWVEQPRSDRAIDWYFFGHGRDYARALSDFTQVAGRIPMPPRFVFGMWWSRYWAYSDQELKDLVAEFDAKHVPLEVLVIDMDWHLDGWTGYTWHPKYFPDPAGFLSWCRREGLYTTLNLHPADGVGRHEAMFADMCRAMGMDPATTERVPFRCADRRFVDAYFAVLHHPNEKLGIDFWWMDWQQGRKSGFPGLDPLFWLNYLHWTDMERNAARANERPLIFSRWGGLGNHRYPIGFSGDVHTNWASLAFQVGFTATAGNVGYAYWSHDIGGHQPGAVTPEIYTRWVQWGALSPVLRTHGTKNPAAERRIWAFGDEAFAAMRDAVRLRYTLLPVFEAAARRAYDTGRPLLAPLYHECPDEEEAYNAWGEYLLGPDLLVAPVTAPRDPASGLAPVDIWFPPGEWIDWFTGETHEGPARKTLRVPLERIPLFARAGSIIPACDAEKVRRIKDIAQDARTLHVFPGARGATELYQDDGHTTGYQRGECAFTTVRQRTTRGRTILTIEATRGSFPGMATSMAYRIVLHGRLAAKDVRINGEAPKRSDRIRYDEALLATVIELAPRKRSEALGIDVRTATSAAFCTAYAEGARARLALLRTLAAAGQGSLAPLAKLAASTGGEAAKVAALLKAIQPAALLPIAREALASSGVDARGILRLLGVEAGVDLRLLEGGTVRLAVYAQVAGSTLALVRLDTEVPIPGGWEASFPQEDDDPSRESVIDLQPQGLLQPTTLAVDFAVHVAPVRGNAKPIVADMQYTRTVFPSINAWKIIGPFANPWAQGLGVAFIDEQKPDFRATAVGLKGKPVKWKKAVRSFRDVVDPESEFVVDLNVAFGGRFEDTVAYAAVIVESDADRDALLAIGSDDGVAAFLNGERVHENHVGRSYQSQADKVPLRLRKGDNLLLLKISQGVHSWAFGAHLQARDGSLLRGVRYRLP